MHRHLTASLTVRSNPVAGAAWHAAKRGWEKSVMYECVCVCVCVGALVHVREKNDTVGEGVISEVRKRHDEDECQSVCVCDND